MTQIAVSIGAKLNISPLELLKTDIDEFILLLNYFLHSNNDTDTDVNTTTRKDNRIRVNDKTATGGWF